MEKLKETPRELSRKKVVSGILTHIQEAEQGLEYYLVFPLAHSLRGKVDIRTLAEEIRSPFVFRVQVWHEGKLRDFEVMRTTKNEVKMVQLVPNSEEPIIEAVYTFTFDKESNELRFIVKEEEAKKMFLSGLKKTWFMRTEKGNLGVVIQETKRRNILCSSGVSLHNTLHNIPVEF